MGVVPHREVVAGEIFRGIASCTFSCTRGKVEKQLASGVGFGNESVGIVDEFSFANVRPDKLQFLLDAGIFEFGRRRILSSHGICSGKEVEQILVAEF